MKKQWKVKEPAINVQAALPEYPPLILKLLALRGLTEAEPIRNFLNPDYANLHDPFRFKDMQIAVERINFAIEKQQKITIFADYDADAITACATLYLALKKLDAQVNYYIPDRFSEGYGLNTEAIKNLCETGTSLIITVDCGINANEEALICKDTGVDLIITDHHELTGSLPEAFAIINPKNLHDEYPFAFLTGVGVAFKLVQALFSGIRNQESGIRVPEGWEKWLLDLVALGTVADLQSLTDENRILVGFGLKVLAKTKNLGMKALLASASLKSDKYDTFTFGFILAPRINAAGRIKHADIAFRLLVCEDPAEAEVLARELNELNLHRQTLTEQITSEARAQIELMADKKVLLVHGPDWPKGVVGLVAGRLAEEFNRPVLALSSSDGFATGSARSILNFNIVEALGFAKDLLQKYGGHPQAAGFSLAAENIPALHQKLLEYAENLNLIIDEPILEIDAETDPTDITWENLNYLDSLSPFGIGNPKPKLAGRNLEVIDCRTVGGQNQHLKMRVRFGEHVLESIAFKQGFLSSQLLPGTKFDAVFELAVNEWNGHKDMQLKILDIRIENKDLYF